MMMHLAAYFPDLLVVQTVRKPRQQIQAQGQDSDPSTAALICEQCDGLHMLHVQMNLEAKASAQRRSKRRGVGANSTPRSPSQIHC